MLLKELLTKAVGYISLAATQSETIQKAGEQLKKFYEWVYPFLIEEVEEETIVDLEQSELAELIVKLMKDKNFSEKLAEQVKTLNQTDLKKKNIFEGDIDNIEEIIIGDEVYDINDVYYHKNIVKGNISKGKKFRLGDTQLPKS